MSDGDRPPAGAAPQPASPHIALVLFDFGAPADAADCGAYLRRLLADIHVTQSPFGLELQKAWAALAAPLYAPAVKDAISAAGGRAPEPAAIEELARSVAAILSTPARRFAPYRAFRHSSPTVVDVVRQARADGYCRIEAVWARPFPSHSGSEAARAEAGLATEDNPSLDLSVLDRWDDLPAIQACWAQACRSAFDSLPESARAGAHVLYTLQSLPIAGTIDPWLEPARSFASAIHQKAELQVPHSVSYQRRTHPRAALEPDAEAEIARLGRTGCKALVVAPLVSAVETLATRWEADVILKAAAREAGITHFARAACPASLPAFPEALAGAVRRHLEEMERLRT